MKSFIIASILFIATSGAGKRIGFGVGQTIGEHLLTPSLFTMRITIGKSFVIAPEVNFRYGSSDAGIDSIKTSTFGMGLESNLYYSLVKKEKTKFYGIGGIGFESSTEVREWYEHEYHPDTLVIKVEHTTSTSSQGLNLGLGLEHFLTNNLSLFISSLSNIKRTSEKIKEEKKGDTETMRDTSGFLFDFQNLKCCIYLIWYL
ncbi:hypothetical protein KAW50_00350 [candidate division WOR-3 bacterium]|nr:hypothetical protein [candidate division WOR-3 bacterium]